MILLRGEKWFYCAEKNECIARRKVGVLQERKVRLFLGEANVDPCVPFCEGLVCGVDARGGEGGYF